MARPARVPRTPTPAREPEAPAAPEVPLEEMFLVPKDLLQEVATILGNLPYAQVAHVLNPIVQLAPLEVQSLREPDGEATAG